VNDHPQDLSLREQARAIAEGELDATELLEATLARIEERNGALRAIADTFASESVRMLSEAPEGPLHGVPIAVKDMFALPWRAPRDGCVENIFGVGAGESAVYRRLRDAGAVIVAVTNMHELGAGSTGHISAYGPCATPWDTSRCGGGSSGGSGAAVGARLVAGAIGTDGGGSIRYPASYCGVTGLKLTWGLVSPEGYTHGFASMGAPGPMCRDSADARLLGGALLGRPLGSRRAAALRIGLAPKLWRDIDPEVEDACRAAIAALSDAGMQTHEVELDGLEHVVAATVIRLTIEGAPSREPEAFRRVEPHLSPIGRALAKYNLLLPAAALAAADRVRAQLRRSLARAFETVDVLAWPTTPAPAPPLDDPAVELPSGRVPADYANVRQGGIGNLAGTPAISVPCGLTGDRLPVGLQLLAPWGEDERLLDVAELLEQATDRRYVETVPPIASAEPSPVAPAGGPGHG
jgi:aspartyl-tRNA(Asn)/glutamyl-tRNA(Gln) amidotransferase subunit A